MKLPLYFPSSRHQWHHALFPDRDYHPLKSPLWRRERFPSRRSINAVGFLCCALMLAYAYYLEFFEGLVPCPL